MQLLLRLSLVCVCLGLSVANSLAADAPKKQTLAVLPFVPAKPADQTLADKMRFAVSQKMSREGNYDRKDNVEIDQAISALQIVMSEMPSDDELDQIVKTLAADRTVFGSVKDRTLTLTLFEGTKKLKTVSAVIPPDVESPRLTMEKLLTDLADVKFTHMRDVECDHSDPAVEALFAKRPNLAPDPSFELASKDPKHVAAAWGAILGADRYPPPLISADEAKTLAQDRVAIVPVTVVGPATEDVPSHCLMMRMSKNIAENNGLACESTWIPVENNKKYRFTVDYHSTGPTPRLFLKGFAVKPDQFGDKADPEAVRREYYRYQVLPRKKNAGWELIEADFTPSVKTDKDPPVQWLRVDLYIYLSPGDVFFDHVTVKKIEKE